ncbi:MAG: Crp/Fnr family transcriptional regulator [Sphingobacteriaceae bacterium]|nr:Crp/Fnr family transcriptional regulator [Sphingobacteriaceae bacterium]
MLNYDLILKNVNKHIQLNKEEKEFFISLLHHKFIKRKDFLCRLGEYSKSENFIIKGCLRTYTLDENGVEHIIAFGIEDWWAGDPYSFLTNSPSNYYIDALEDTEVFQISKENLENLLETIPKFERYYRILFQNAYVAQQKRINQNISFSAEQRYLEFLQKFPSLEQRISQKQISSYLGITPVFLSMLKKKISTR